MRFIILLIGLFVSTVSWAGESKFEVSGAIRQFFVADHIIGQPYEGLQFVNDVTSVTVKWEKPLDDYQGLSAFLEVGTEFNIADPTKATYGEGGVIGDDRAIAGLKGNWWSVHFGRDEHLLWEIGKWRGTYWEMIMSPTQHLHHMGGRRFQRAWWGDIKILPNLSLHGAYSFSEAHGVENQYSFGAKYEHIFSQALKTDVWVAHWNGQTDENWSNQIQNTWYYNDHKLAFIVSDNEGNANADREQYNWLGFETHYTYKFDKKLSGTLGYGTNTIGEGMDSYTAGLDYKLDKNVILHARFNHSNGGDKEYTWGAPGQGDKSTGFSSKKRSVFGIGITIKF